MTTTVPLGNTLIAPLTTRELVNAHTASPTHVPRRPATSRRVLAAWQVRAWRKVVGR